MEYISHVTWSKHERSYRNFRNLFCLNVHTIMIIIHDVFMFPKQHDWRTYLWFRSTLTLNYDRQVRKIKLNIAPRLEYFLIDCLLLNVPWGSFQTCIDVYITGSQATCFEYMFFRSLSTHHESLSRHTWYKPLVLQSHPNLAAFSNWQGIRETLF